METLYVADKSIAELEQLFACDVDDNDFYDVIAYNIAQIEPEYLPQKLEGYDGFRLRGALFGIGCSPERNNPQVDLLRSYFTHADPLVVAESVGALKNAENTEQWTQVSKLALHESPYVRGAVLRYAAFALSEDEAFAVLTGALNDKDSIVLQHAIDELGELGNPKARNPLFPFLESENDDVREAAKTALDSLR